MSSLITRRGLITAGVIGVTGGAAALATRSLTLPPDRFAITGVAESLTYEVQRLLSSGQPLAREFSRDQISKVHPVNGPAPKDDIYRAHLANGFRDWRLKVDGLVARPVSLSLDDLKRIGGETRITLHACEQGWSYIAEWTGVRLSRLLEVAGAKPNARFVMFVPFPNPQQQTGIVRQFWDSVDMAEALHPQTLIAYGMNGADIPADHGAPVRLRLTRQLGYKNIKFLQRIVVTDNMEKFGGTRTGVRDATWYGGI